MSISYPIFLSTTQSNDNIPSIIIRQFDEGTQVFDVTVTEHGKPKDISNLTPFFCVKQGHHAGIGISEQKVNEIVDAKKGKIRYTLTNYDMQNIGENTAYFSFRELKKDLNWKQQFSTRDFSYQVKESIYEDGIKDSNYIWTFEEILRYFTEWVKNCQEVYDDWYIVAQEELQRIIKEFQFWISTNQGKYDEWLDSNKQTFVDWFKTIKGILNEDAAGNLLFLLDELEKKINLSIEKIKEHHFTLFDREIGVLVTLQDDKFSKNHVVQLINKVISSDVSSALIIAEVDNKKQDTFYLSKVGEIK